MKHAILCETRPWSGSTGRGKFSLDPLDDRHEGGAKPGAGGQSALAELCRLYWYPLYVFARLSGHSPEGAQDLMQGFFLHLVEDRAPAGVSRFKGKFRSFLLASLQSYLSDELDRAREEVGRTVGNPAEIDGEIHVLCQALVASEGWLGSVKIEDRRTCSVCGTEFSAKTEFCPDCVLRRGLGETPKSDESLEKASVDSSPALLAHRFEHYELVNGEDGKPIELGRGAMGVTYKAFDVDLHCPVTLKVISENYLGEESARLRFLREARAAAISKPKGKDDPGRIHEDFGDFACVPESP